MSFHRSQEMTAGDASVADCQRSDAVDAVIKTRFASRSFSSRAVPRQMLEDVLDVARYCPSGGNIQPWHVYLVSGSKKTEVATSLLDAHENARHQHASEYNYYAAVLPEPYRSRKDEFGRLFYGALGIDQADAGGRARQTAKTTHFLALRSA